MFLFYVTNCFTDNYIFMEFYTYTTKDTLMSNLLIKFEFFFNYLSAKKQNNCVYQVFVALGEKSYSIVGMSYRFLIIR